MPVRTEQDVKTGKDNMPTGKTRFIVKPKEKKIIIERILNAPRELVFKAYTEPKHISNWWGPRELKTAIDKMEVKPGGVWRFIQRDFEGNEFAFNGVYKEIIVPEKIVSTFEFKGMPGHVLVQTVSLEDLDEKTKLTTTSLYESLKDLEGMLGSGMEKGSTESMERLSELLASMQL
jgi:uncharacterized protein YndB with AHSA1/START domain